MNLPVDATVQKMLRPDGCARRRKPVGAASPEATRLPTANHATDFAVDKPKLRKRSFGYCKIAPDERRHGIGCAEVTHKGRTSDADRFSRYCTDTLCPAGKRLIRHEFLRLACGLLDIRKRGLLDNHKPREKRMKTKCSAALAATFGLLWAGCLNAGTITCMPDNQRVATLSDALECKTLNSVNLNSPAQIDALYDDLGDPWVLEGTLTGAGSNDLLTVTANSWGVDVDGNWYIAASFWSTYSRAVITMHVGQGGGNPDAFAWLITPGEATGSFSYERIAGTGGGLANMLLFGSGQPLVRVPEPGTLALLGLGLAGLGLSRRRKAN